MAQRIWICSVVATLALLGYVQCQDATACDALHACINETASTTDGQLSAYPDLPDAEKQALCEKIFSDEGGFLFNLTACKSEATCSESTVDERVTEVATKYILSFNYTCMAGIYYDPDPCVGASYCTGSVTTDMRRDMNGQSNAELQVTCDKLRNNQSVPGWDIEKCSVMAVFCSNTSAVTKLNHDVLEAHKQLLKNCVTGGEEDEEEEIEIPNYGDYDFSEFDDCVKLANECEEDLRTALDKAGFEMQGYFYEKQKEFCEVVDDHDLSATVTALAQCFANAYKSDECKGMPELFKPQFESRMLYDHICLEYCSDGYNKFLNMSTKCLDREDSHEETEEEKTEEEAIEALCNKIGGNKDAVECAERESHCCPLVTHQFVSYLIPVMTGEKCTEAKSTLRSICNSAGANASATLLVALLLAASHALL